MSIFTELKRRNVYKVGIAYVVTAWLVLQVSDVVLNNVEAPGWVFRVIMLALAAGFPLVLIFAWAFELTPEGIKRERDVDRSESITQQTGKKLNLAIIAILAVAAGYFFWESRLAGPGAEVTPQVQAGPDAGVSIAVLPFVNMSSDAEQEYFSDGISEEILNVLAHVPDLHVTSRSSAFQFKGENIDIPTVAKQLGVGHVLEGSVRKSGNTVRITAQLIEASSDRHMWSETYDRQLTDVFAIQDEISTAIVEALTLALDIDIAMPAATQRVVSSDAYNHYLQGVYQMEQRTPATLRAAIEHFEQAIALEEDYAPALARLTIALNLYPQYASGLSHQEYIEKAEPFVERALKLDPEHWETNLAMGSHLWQKATLAGTNRDDVIPYLEKAIRLNPSFGTAYAWLASVKREQGKSVESLEILESAVQIAPLDRIILDNLSGGYIRRARYNEAQVIIDRLMTVSPYMAHSRAAFMATSQGRWADNAIALIQRQAVAPESSNFWPRRIVGDDLGLPAEALTIGQEDSYCALYVYLDRTGEVRPCVERRLESESGIFRTYDEGIFLFLEGDIAKGHELMEQAWAQFDHSNPSIPAPEQIAARMALGDQEGALELRDRAIEFVESRREAGLDQTVDFLSLGMAHYLVGDKDKALPHLNETVRRGLFIRTYQDYLEDFRNDPDIARLLARQQAKTEMERERFLTIMCGEANPVADFWKPSSEACGLVAAAG